MKIECTNGLFAIIDDDDYEKISSMKWRSAKIGRTYYAFTGRGMGMHRIIMNTPTGMDTDHIDGNGMNNRKENLRVVTHRENLNNRHHSKSSKFAGVHFVKGKNYPWQANIQRNGKVIYLGSFLEESDAAERYRIAKDCISRGIEIPENISRINKTSKYVGVSLNHETGKWIAQIRIFGKQRKLGAFKSEEEAHVVYTTAKNNMEYLESCQRYQ